jgi:hypothetical protein
MAENAVKMTGNSLDSGSGNGSIWPLQIAGKQGGASAVCRFCEEFYMRSPGEEYGGRTPQSRIVVDWHFNNAFWSIANDL